jgi:murein tripeptide amidase MpaA
VLCKTFNGLDLPLLTIGNADSKEVIVISARVHPGETVSSFIAEGFLK